jgi:3-methyladenine DNA glycosylase AlkD
MEEVVSTVAIRQRIGDLADNGRARAVARYFQACPGGYGEGDVFAGISMPNLRALAKACDRAPMGVVRDLLASPVHEERMLALLMLVRRFASASPDRKKDIVDLYLGCTDAINNWDLVDATAPHIVGDYLLGRDPEPLYRLACSESLWERRIAVVSTLTFIRTGVLGHTFVLARMLLNDPEDLIHKAVGWMLREAGKRDEASLIAFLDEHGRVMPRTMLRYAIERLPSGERARCLAMGRKASKGERAGHD